MTVYVVLLEDNNGLAYDGRQIQAIYDTREAAEAHRDAVVLELVESGYIVFGLNGNVIWDYDVVIEEWDVQTAAT